MLYLECAFQFYSRPLHACYFHRCSQKHNFSINACCSTSDTSTKLYMRSRFIENSTAIYLNIFQNINTDLKAKDGKQMTIEKEKNKIQSYLIQTNYNRSKQLISNYFIIKFLYPCMRIFHIASDHA